MRGAHRRWRRRGRRRVAGGRAARRGRPPRRSGPRLPRLGASPRRRRSTGAGRSSALARPGGATPSSAWVKWRGRCRAAKILRTLASCPHSANSSGSLRFRHQAHGARLREGRRVDGASEADEAWRIVGWRERSPRRGDAAGRSRHGARLLPSDRRAPAARPIARRTRSPRWTGAAGGGRRSGLSRTPRARAGRGARRRRALPSGAARTRRGARTTSPVACLTRPRPGLRSPRPTRERAGCSPACAISSPSACCAATCRCGWSGSCWPATAPRRRGGDTSPPAWGRGERRGSRVSPIGSPGSAHERQSSGRSTAWGRAASNPTGSSWYPRRCSR